MYLGELTPIQESQLVQLKSWVSELLKGKVRILSLRILAFYNVTKNSNFRYLPTLYFCVFCVQEISMWKKLGKCYHNLSFGGKNMEWIKFCQNTSYHRS